MRLETIALGAWGVWLGLLASVLAFFRPEDAYAPILLAGGAAIVLALAALSQRAPVERPRALAETSVPTVLVVTGLSLALLGVPAGLWLILIGAEVFLVGLVLLIRELAAQRREAR